MSIDSDVTQAIVMPPRQQRGPLAWMARNLFSTWTSTVVTLVLGFLLGYAGVSLLRWAILDAVWFVPGNTIEDTALCRTADAGACWAIVREKYRFILFGLYPHAEQWRPAWVIVLLIGLFLASTNPRWWGRSIFVMWLIGLAAVYALMAGGVFGLTPVPEDRWGGLPVTLVLASVGMALAFPLAILVALGRSSSNPSLRFVCYVYVELVRGVPLISVLFMASVLLPLFLPDGITISKLLRAQFAIIFFIAAYLSELIRAGLQSIDRGQTDAAASLGLGYWQQTLLIRLPQALIIALPTIVSLCIGLFKSTSLVMTIGIFDLLNAAKSAAAEPAWQGFSTEAYLFATAIYFAFCLAMSRYGQHVERRLRRSR